MLFNILLKKNKKYFLHYYIKPKLNKKFKKLIKHNKYLKIYNPRGELNVLDKILTNKNKFYFND